MSIRVIIYLKSNSGPKPYRACYFAVREYERLMKDFTQYQQYGTPQTGTYTEDISSNDEQMILMEFGTIAELRTPG